MPSFKHIPEELSKQFFETMWSEYGQGYTLPDWLLSQPKTPQPITREERVQGLATIWAEARTSYAYWDRLKDLDWDAAFREYLPRVEAAEDPDAYYRLLRQFVRLLEEGHSYVAMPSWLQGQHVGPPVGFSYVEAQPVVVRGELLPLGSVITRIDGRPVAECLTEAAGLVFASTHHDRMNKACNRLLLGAEGSNVEVEFRHPDGTTRTAQLSRTGSLPARPSFEKHDLGQGRILIRINTWMDEAVVARFHEAFPDFDGISALIIDQRYNGGGNSGNGEQILAGTVSATKVTFPDGTPLIGVGVTPDIAVAPTIAGIAAGRDEVLERAIEVLESAR